MSANLSECDSRCPAAFGAYYHWRNWHRGTGCSKDDGQPRDAESAQLIAKLGEDHPRVIAPPSPTPAPAATAADLRAFIEEVVASAPIESQVSGYDQHTGNETFDGVICTGCVNSAATEDEIQHDPKCLRMRGAALLAQSIADADKIGVFTYRSTMGTYTLIVDLRDNAHECFRGANLHGPGNTARSRHTDWQALPREARDYFAACMAGDLDGRDGAA